MIKSPKLEWTTAAARNARILNNAYGLVAHSIVAGNSIQTTFPNQDVTLIYDGYEEMALGEGRSNGWATRDLALQMQHAKSIKIKENGQVRYESPIKIRRALERTVKGAGQEELDLSPQN